MPNRLILEIDASNWKSMSDYCAAMCAALGSPEGHGCSVAAFIDSMVYGDMNAVEPPYTIRIKGTKLLPTNILEEIEALKQALPRHCTKGNEWHDIVIELVP
ncbi:MAG: hypothetical protein ACAH80_14375 [Alphaproteobacteria bacterium]